MEWNLQKIEDLINEKIEENLNLDYKASDSLQHNDKKANEISKDVSAFANSDGGVIIYGIREDSQNKHLPESIDPIERNEISKEWLEQIIQSRIRPRIDNIVIHPIPFGESIDRVIYVVEIPQSNTAHQASDRKYYKRYNFNSEPMYDYEIRDILNRTKFPIIDLEFEIIKKTFELKPIIPQMPTFSMDANGLMKSSAPKNEYKTEYRLNIYAVNNGKVLANYINAYAFIPCKYLEEKDESSENISRIFMDNTIRDVVDAQILPSMSGTRSIPKYGPSRYDPILPTRNMRLEKLFLKKNILDSSDKINWVVYVDNSEPRKGEIELKSIEIIDK
jgi:hypothetical protein